MSTNENAKSQPADLTGLGQFGLAMVTLVASSQKLGITHGLSYALPWAIFLGGLAQLMAAISDYKRNNVFGATVFGAFALFWFSVAFSWVVKLGAFGQVMKSDIDVKQIGFAYLGFLVFVIAMTIASTKTNKVTFVILCLVNVLLLGLSLNSFGIGGDFTHKMAAVAEMLISVVGFYACAATLLNHQFQKVVLPVGKPF